MCVVLSEEHLNSEDSAQIQLSFTDTGLTLENDAQRHSRGHSKWTYKFGLNVMLCPGGVPAQGFGGDTPGNKFKLTLEFDALRQTREHSK